MSQTSVSLTAVSALPGLPAKDRLTDWITGISGESDDGLAVGDFVYISDYNDRDGLVVKKMETTAASTTACDGVILYDSRQQGQIKNKGTVSIVRKGLVYVKASWFSGAISAGAQLAYDLSAGKFIAGGDAKFDESDGTLHPTATLGAGDILVTGLRLFSAVTAAEATAGTKLLQVEVNFPSSQFVAQA